MKKRLLSLLLAGTMMLSLLPATAVRAAAADATAVVVKEAKAGYNRDLHDYMRNDGTFAGKERCWSEVVYSSLTELPDGRIMRTEYLPNDKTMVVEYYDKSFKLLSQKFIPLELGKYGGFYAGTDYYFVLYGQENKGEDDNLETFRVVKYSKDWERLGQASTKDTFTVDPFYSGSADMAELNGKLYIHTSHAMYNIGDGQNHQASITFTVDIASMAFTAKCGYEEAAASGNKADYASHSFNQYIAVGADGSLFTADHGDATPRAMAVTKRDAANIAKGNTRATFLPFAGTSGQPFTGAQLGGMAVSSSSVLTVGTSIDQSKTDGRDLNLHNVFVAVTPKGNLSAATAITYLTDYKAGVMAASNPYLVELGNDRYMVIWSEKPVSNDAKLGYTYDKNDRNDPVLCYVVLNADGKQLGSINKTRARLSDCAPILTSDNNILWYTSVNGATTFYSFPVGDLSALQPGTPGTGGETQPEATFKELTSGLYRISFQGNYMGMNKDGFAELNRSAADTYYKIEQSVGGYTIQTADGAYLGTKTDMLNEKTTVTTLKKPYYWYIRSEGGTKYKVFSSASSNQVFAPRGGKAEDGTLLGFPMSVMGLEPVLYQIDFLAKDGGATAPAQPEPTPSAATATPSPTKLTVNGKSVSVDTYAINQSNYIKLRDLAYLINGTGKSFEVQWDGSKNAINLLSKTAYTPTKGDMTLGDGQRKTATPASSAIYVDGAQKQLTAYLIGQNNYFKLRDVMQAFDVYVGYDNTTGTAIVDTNRSYQ